jgi:hypothetical protein
MAKVTILHMDAITEKSGHQMTGMAVSVCLTPAAPSPVPIPYPTIGTVAEGIVDPCMRLGWREPRRGAPDAGAVRARRALGQPGRDLRGHHVRGARRLRLGPRHDGAELDGRNDAVRA